MEKALTLPKPSTEGGAPVWEVLASRRSIRNYGEEPMPLDVLSQLLWSTHGITGMAGGTGLRNAPSAGACYPIDVYVVANSVHGVEPGLHRYLAEEHALLPVRLGDVGSEIAAAALGQTMCRTGSVTLVWTAVSPRTAGPGHVGQNTYLAATALGYGCCTIGAFDDEAMNEAVGVDGKIETVVYAASIGPIE